MKTGRIENLPLTEMLIARFHSYWDMKKPGYAIEQKIDYLILLEANI